MKSCEISIAGSRLYGTATETSDYDYRGIYIPSYKDILLTRVKKTINDVDLITKVSGVELEENADVELYSLPYFVELACQGQTVVMDLLYSTHWLTDVAPWLVSLLANRRRFLSKNVGAFMGYAKSQAAKYCIKGERLEVLNQVISKLQRWNKYVRLSVVWGCLPVTAHSDFIEDSPKGIGQYKICGRIVQETQTVGYTLDGLQKFKEKYGKRAEEAMENKGVDWKALSHAYRVVNEMMELLVSNEITFPLDAAGTILEIKQGKVDYKKVVEWLDRDIAKVDNMLKNSNWPETVDREWWDDWSVETLKEVYTDD